MIPSGYQFSDPITGKQYTDLHTLFDQRVRDIIRDRLANHRLFTDDKFVSTEYVTKELSAQNCARLKNNPLFCSNGLPPTQPANVPKPVAVVGKVCRYCGSSNLTEIVCATCGGRKVTGYKCQNCGKDNPK